MIERQWEEDLWKQLDAQLEITENCQSGQSVFPFWRCMLFTFLGTPEPKPDAIFLLSRHAEA